MPDPERTLPPRLAWALTLVATSTMAVSYVDRQAVAALGPTITDELHIGEAAFGWLGSAFSVAYLVGAPLAGRMIDAVGARRGLVGSVLVWSAVSALHGLVPGFGALLVLRVLLGLAESPSFPGAAQTVTRALPAHQRSVGFGILFTGSSIGAAISAVVAPTLAIWWGWRGALVGTAVVGLAWIPLWLAVTGPAAARAALDQEGPRTENGGWTALLAMPSVWRALAATIASAPTVGLVLQFGAKLLASEHGVTQAGVRTFLWLPPLLFDAGAVGIGLLGTLYARRHPGVPPRALFAVAAALTAMVGLVPLTHTPWGTTLALGFALAGAGGVYALATADMLTRVPANLVASAGGLTAAAQSLSLIVAFPLIGYAVESSRSYHVPALALAAWVVPGAVFWLLVSPLKRA